jgi:hypothetical protein
MISSTSARPWPRTDKIRAAIDRIRGKSLPKPGSGDPDELS